MKLGLTRYTVSDKMVKIEYRRPVKRNLHNGEAGPPRAPTLSRERLTKVVGRCCLTGRERDGIDMGKTYVFDDDKLERMGREARTCLEQARRILSEPGCTESDAARAEGLRLKAKEIIDRAKKYKDILIASGRMDEQVKGDGMGKNVEVLDDGGFETFKDFLMAVRECDKGYRDPRLVKATKAMVEGSGVAGGYMVPAQHQAEVMAIEAEAAIVEPRARVFDMTSRELNIPALDQTGSTAGKSHFHGSIEFKWTEEGGSKPSVEPELKQIKLVPHGLKGYAEVSDELLEDSSPSISEWLAGLFGEAIAWYKDQAYLTGDGVGKPHGIIGAPGTFTQLRANGGAVQYVDIINMNEHIWGKALVWIIHRTVKAQLLTMQDPNGNYIWQPGSGLGGRGIGGPVPGTLLGYPVLESEHCSTLGTTGDILLCDLSKYYIGRRSGVSIETSRDYKFRDDITAFRIHCRVDGQEANQQPIYLADGATQVSPFVELDAATA